MDDSALITAAQRGDQLAFERLLRRYQGLLDAQGSRFFLPGGDQDDVAQEARIAFMKAVHFYRDGRGSSFRAFARLFVSRQLASAVTVARRATSRSASRHEASGPNARWPPCPTARNHSTSSPPGTGWVTSSAGWRVQRDRAQGARPHSRGLVDGEAARRLGLPRRSTDNALQRAKRKLDGWQEGWAV